MSKKRLLGAGIVAGTMLVGAAGGPALAAQVALGGFSAGPVKRFPGNFYPSSVSCPPGTAVSAATCWAVGTNGASTPLLARVVHGVPRAPVAIAGGSFIACPAAGVCAVGGETPSGQVEVWRYHQRRVTNTVTVTGINYVNGISCESASTCVVVGGRYGTTTPSGTPIFGAVGVVPLTSSSAAAFTLPGVDGYLNGVSCPTPTSCTAVGENGMSNSSHGVVVTITGGKAGKVHVINTTTEGYAVSCATARKCWALADKKPSASKGITTVVVAVTKGRPGNRYPGPEEANALSCVSTTLCALAGGVPTHGNSSNGMVAEIVSGKVKHSTVLPGFAEASLTALSCPTPTSCLAGGPISFLGSGNWSGGTTVLHL